MLLRHAVQNRKFTISGRVFTFGPTRCRSKTSKTPIFAPGSEPERFKSGKDDVERSENSKGSANSPPIITPGWTLQDALQRPMLEDDTIFLEPISETKVPVTKSETSGYGPQAYQSAKWLYRDPKISAGSLGWSYDPVESPLPPTPTTRKELVRNIVAMCSANPVIPLVKIVDYHSTFPWLHTPRSFNALISLAVRHTAVKTTRMLIRGMKAQNIYYTERTLVLITRLRLRVAHRVFQFLRLGRNPPGVMPRLMSDIQSLERHPHLHAWILHQEVSQSALLNTLQHNGSLRILREHLTISHRRHSNRYKQTFLYAYRRELRMLEDIERMLREGDTPFAPRWHLLRQRGTHTLNLPEVSKRTSVMRSAYSRLESLPAACFDPSANPVPSAAVQQILNDEALIERFRRDRATFSLFIRRLLLEGLRGTAFTHAMAYIRHLCHGVKSLPEGTNANILTVLHILMHRKYGCVSYKVGMKILTEILAIHPDIKPNATTLYVLLQTLRGASRRGVRAVKALEWFAKRWEDVEDERVRRTIAKYGLEERSEKGLGIAWDMAEREARYGTRWRDSRGSFHDLRGSQAMAFERTFTYHCRDRNKWVRMGLIHRRQGFVLVEDKARPLKATRGVRRTEEPGDRKSVV